MYCVSCYIRLFGIKGYGYGVGSGILSIDIGTVGEVVFIVLKIVFVNIGRFGIGKSCLRCNRVVYDVEKIRVVGKVN